MDNTAPPPDPFLFELMELPDKCLLVLAQLLAAQDKPSLRALTRTCTRLQDLALPALSEDICTQLITTKQHKSLLRYLQAHGSLSRSLVLQGRPEQWDMGENHGTCSLSSPHIKSLPEPAQVALEGLGISCLRVAPESLLTANMVLLRALDISDCIVTGTATEDSLRAGLVAVGPSLRSLRIRRLFEHRGFMQLYSVPFPNAALPSLTGLTSLELRGSVRSSAQLSVLTALRELSIQTDGGFDMAAEGLPASDQLTSLMFRNVVEDPDDGPFMAPAALSRVPALRRLVLSTYMAPDQGGTAALLAELAKLTALTMLVLDAGPLEPPLGAQDAAAYASLTASSDLQALTLRSAQLPEGAWQHVIGPSKQLPRLKSLVMKNYYWDRPHFKEGESRTGAMTAADLAGLSVSCPGLTSLVLGGVYEPGTPLVPLLSRLTALQSLDVQHVSDADASTLLQLPQLQQLRLMPCSLSEEGILQLTQLTQLTDLVLQLQGKQAEGGRTNIETVRCTNKAPAGAPSDVPSQLLADRQRRKDPEAMEAWKKQQEKDSVEWFRQMFGGGAAAAPAGAPGDDDGGDSSSAGDEESEWETDSEGAGGPPNCVQQ